MNDLEIQFIKDTFGTTKNHTLDEAFEKFHEISGIDIDELKVIAKDLHPNVEDWSF